MKSVTALVLLALLPCAVPCAARPPQDKGAGREKAKPDLGGQWVPDEEAEGAGKSSRRTADAPTRLVVLHSGAEVRFRRTTTTADGATKERESIYYADGRGEKNVVPAITDRPGVVREEEVKSRTVWKGDKLVTRTVARPLAVGRSAYVETVEEWKLSADGKRLTRTLTVTIDIGGGRGAPLGPGVSGVPSPVQTTVLGGFVRESKVVYRRAP